MKKISLLSVFIIINSISVYALGMGNLPLAKLCKGKEIMNRIRIMAMDDGDLDAMENAEKKWKHLKQRNDSELISKFKVLNREIKKFSVIFIRESTKDEYSEILKSRLKYQNSLLYNCHLSYLPDGVSLEESSSLP